MAKKRRATRRRTRAAPKRHRKNVIIMGAAGRDFHNFNVFFKDNRNYDVVAFTAAQIPDISGRMYPKELAGKLYPKGISIYPEEDLSDLIKRHNVHTVILAYSDISHLDVMHKASLVLAAGADFRLMGLASTMLESKVPVISVCAVRTGCGKSQTSRRVCHLLKNKGFRVVVIRHPMPYGDLVKEACQRFATHEDMDRQKCTIEEREEYEPHINHGIVVYAGVDYRKILRAAEKEADIIVWDGGNNDIPFYKPDLHLVVADPHRAGHELLYYPGETNFRMADVIIINKIDTAEPDKIAIVEKNIEEVNPQAIVIRANSPLTVDNPELVRGKRALVVEDGPTLTHGGMLYGAGVKAAEQLGAELVDPRPYAVGSIKNVFEKYAHLGRLLPAMGYSEKQISELEETINKADCDVVVIGTPIDLRRLIHINKPAVRVGYELEEIGNPNLEEVLAEFRK